MDFTAGASPSTSTYKGYTATVEIGPDQVVIARKAITRLVRNHSAVIPWQDIREIRFRDPSLMWNGYLWFVTGSDPAELTKSGRGGNAIAGNPHTIMFTNRQREAYLEARKTAEATLALHRGRLS